MNLDGVKNGGLEHGDLTASEAFELSEKYNIALHPEYTYCYHDVTIRDLNSLIELILKHKEEYDPEKGLELPLSYQKRVLEILGVPHIVRENKIIIDKQPIELKLPLFVYGNKLDNGDANNNQVITNNSQISIVYGGWGINANNNKVILNNGSNPTYVIGGYSETGEDKPGETNGNTVIINKSTVKNVYGGYSHNGCANNNIVIIDNSVVDDNVPSAIIGGYVPRGKSATGNTVKIIGKSNIENARIYGQDIRWAKRY